MVVKNFKAKKKRKVNFIFKVLHFRIQVIPRHFFLYFYVVVKCYLNETFSPRTAYKKPTKNKTEKQRQRQPEHANKVAALTVLIWENMISS